VYLGHESVLENRCILGHESVLENRCILGQKKERLRVGVSWDKLKSGKRGQKTKLTGRSPLGGDGPHCTVVPSKKKNKYLVAQLSI